MSSWGSGQRPGPPRSSARVAGSPAFPPGAEERRGTERRFRTAIGASSLGEWRAGAGDRSRADLDPWSGETPAEIPWLGPTMSRRRSAQPSAPSTHGLSAPRCCAGRRDPMRRSRRTRPGTAHVLLRSGGSEVGSGPAIGCADGRFRRDPHRSRSQPVRRDRSGRPSGSIMRRPTGAVHSRVVTDVVGRGCLRNCPPGLGVLRPDACH